jgi:signal transduction histidine kinase
MTKLSADQLDRAAAGGAGGSSPCARTVAPTLERCGHDMQGLLHDLGHQLMTLSLLAEPLRADSTLSADARQRMELVLREMFRALDMVTDTVAAPGPDVHVGADDHADVRELAGQVAQLCALAYDAEVELLPGPPATLQASPMIIWRVLANLVDNAARAAGPQGRVSISVAPDRAGDVVIEVTDDGPGFESGPAGLAGLGLSVVDGLLRESGGGISVGSTPGRGTSVRAAFAGSAGPALAGGCVEPRH